MSETLGAVIGQICEAFGNDRTRMMDIVRAVQERFGGVSSDAMDLIAAAVGCRRVEVEGVVTFYAFYSEKPKGKVVIRLCNDVVDRLMGYEEVLEAFEAELGLKNGETTADGAITLETTPCIGMCDQAPAAMINDVVVTELSTDKVRRIVRGLKEHGDPRRLITRLGDGVNAHDLVQSEVQNNLRRGGPVIFADYEPGVGLRKALAMSPQEVIREVKVSRLRGRGGAGFPTGMKWEFTRGAAGEEKVVVCNADEGEPGTFKDRVVLTERAAMLFEGMVVAGYAIGAREGILYLRGEYAYLYGYLQKVLMDLRAKGWLGEGVGGKPGFDFDIRIQLGAGAYVCGEETALLSSCEGTRGDPKNRPPFPAQKGYLGKPTTVNNVETYCCVTRVMEQGAGWFAQLGSKGSPGTKLLSVGGDCRSPGVYELEFGVTLAEVLRLVGAEDAIAVQVGGPSGQMVGPEAYSRTICYDDLATGGAIVVFGPQRNVLDVVREYLEFFVEESCGYCTPCRVGNVLLKERIDRILAGKGEPADLDYLKDLGESVKIASRCGLGQTSPNPVLSTLRNFRSVYNALVKAEKRGYQAGFDLAAAVSEAEGITGRKSVHAH